MESPKRGVLAPPLRFEPGIGGRRRGAGDGAGEDIGECGSRG